MQLYEINDQVNRYQNLCPASMKALVQVFQINYPNWAVESHPAGIFRVSESFIGFFKFPIGSPVAIRRVFNFDVSIIYPAMVSDPDIPESLKEECLKHLIAYLGPPDSP